MSGSLYLFYGDEDFFIEEELKRLEKELGVSIDGFSSLERIDGKDGDVGKIISAVMTPTMLGGQRLIVVEDFKWLKAPKKRGDEKGDETKFDEKAREFTDCLKRIPQGITLVFVSLGPVDKRRKAFKLIEKSGEVKEFKPFTDWEQERLLAWIVLRVKLIGKKIGSHAARLLVEISGKNLRSLSKEIEKLATFVGESEWIEEKDVRALASSGQINAFFFSDAVRRKDAKGALDALRRLLKDREQPVRLIGLLASEIRMLLQLKSLEEEGLNVWQMAEKLRANQYYVKKCHEYVSNFALSELKQDIELLHNADVKLKTGGAQPPLILEMLVLDICKACPERSRRAEAKAKA